MAENSTAATIGKFGLGLGVGFGLYWLIRNLGFGAGGGFGGGRGDDARGEGPSVPSGPPSPPAPPSIPRDERPILLWVEAADRGPQPKRTELPDPTARAQQDARFLLVDLGDSKTLAELRSRMRGQIQALRNKSVVPMSLDEAIARIKAGGRDDVRLMTSGGIMSGIWDDSKDALMAAGIRHWLLWEEKPADRKPGDPPKPPRWELFDKGPAPDLNPDKTGHYHVENRGTAYWNLRGDPAPHVSGNARGQYGRGYR